MVEEDEETPGDVEVEVDVEVDVEGSSPDP